jgi:hypothetical protein
LVKERKKSDRGGGKEERRIIRKTMEARAIENGDMVGCTGEVEEENRTKRRIDGTIEGRGLEENLRHRDKKKNKIEKNRGYIEMKL